MSRTSSPLLFGLAPDGVYHTATLLHRACALTARFHPYLCLKTIGGLFSAALSIGLLPPPVRRHLVLWSPDFPLSQRQRLLGPPPQRLVQAEKNNKPKAKPKRK